jgi:DNA mismatch endonuclease, patch repair protein
MDIFTRQKRSQNMAQIRGKDTAPELLVRSILHKLGYRYALHRRDLPGSPDLVFAPRRKVIFIHGCFWHGHMCRRGKLPSSNKVFWTEKVTKNKARDRRVKRQLQTMGWKVLTIWQCELKNDKRIKEKLVSFLSQNVPLKRLK